MELTKFYVKPDVIELIEHKNSFLPLTQYPDLIIDISTKPYTLRYKQTGVIIPEHQNGKYKAWYIQGRSIPIHQLLGEEFLLKDNAYNGKLYIDHIDQDKENNTLENLRYIPPSLNNRNMNHEDLPVFIQLDRPMKIEEYAGKQFSNLFYSQGHFYIAHNGLYYELQWHECKGNDYVHVQQSDGKGLNIYKKKFQKWLKDWVIGNIKDEVDEV